jgi:hypothetical protein
MRSITITFLVCIAAATTFHAWASQDAKSATDAAVPAVDASAAVEAPTTTPAEEKPVKDVVQDVKDLVGAAKAGKWRTVVSLGLMILVWVWRRFLSKWILPKLSSWGVGLATVILGYVASIPAALAAEGFNWGTFVWAGLITSAEAMLLWQMIGKKVLPKMFGEAK